MTRQHAEFDAALAHHDAILEERCAAFERELRARLQQDFAALRRELAAALAELDRLRAGEPAH
jgi:hypothetical protein